MARWSRAVAALPFRGGRVADIGCAFGVATRLLARRGYQTVGVDASPAYIARARKAHPTGTYHVADATALPLATASCAGALLLDVLEHLPDEQAAIREVARILSPGGTLVLSVPYRGPLAALDSLNLYARWVRLTRHGRFPPEIAATGEHRHYSTGEIAALLGPEFAIRRLHCTGLGLAELVHLPILCAFRWLLPWEAAYQVVAFAYYTVYLLEDLLPLGPLGYHLLVVAERRSEAQVGGAAPHVR